MMKKDTTNPGRPDCTGRTDNDAPPPTQECVVVAATTTDSPTGENQTLFVGLKNSTINNKGATVDKKKLGGELRNSAVKYSGYSSSGNNEVAAGDDSGFVPPPTEEEACNGLDSNALARNSSLDNPINNSSTINGPTLNNDSDQELAWRCAEEELEKKQMLNEKVCAYQPREHNEREFVQERTYASHVENETTTSTRPTQSASPPQPQPVACTGAARTTMDHADNQSLALLGPGSGAMETTFPEDNPTALAAATNTVPENHHHNNSNEDDHGLVTAMPVEEDYDSSTLMEAQPVDQQIMDQKAARDANYQKWKRIGCVIVVVVSVACIVLSVSLANGATNEKDSFAVAASETPTLSPSRLLPPMENLQLLYDNLPEKTKESLYNNESPQYEAWEWLLVHPNITNLEEWRKKQLFAMATFFYSFEGPNWPESTPGQNRWMDVNTSECSWAFSDDEIAFWSDTANVTVGLDIQPCHEDGQLQMFGVHTLYLPTDANLSIPPEIELLTSLRFFGIIFSQIHAKLSDFLVPELVQLPNLVHLDFEDSGVSGTIPKDIGLLTGLRQLWLSRNKLSGTIPSALWKLSHMEELHLSNLPNLKGDIPAKIEMPNLTVLSLSGSHQVSGTIGDQACLFIQELDFDCSPLLCGCDCQCVDANGNKTNPQGWN